jgi:tRNA (cmo5U34)-methyltransferase
MDQVEPFRFDSAVAKVFEDMIQRSVPGYRTTLAMIELLTARFVRAGSRVYDLGCSLGAATWIAANARPDCPFEVIAVDNAAPMIERCSALLKDTPPAAKVTLQLGDIRQVGIENASLVLLNFTLQFIPKEDRDALIKRICQGLIPGGALILSEKLSFEDPLEEALLFELHHDFKRKNGYSDLEISQKRSALENRLIPESLQAHRERLNRQGFESVHLWFQCFNFASLIAIKSG